MLSTAHELNLSHLLTRDNWPEDRDVPLIPLTRKSVSKLIERIDTAPLFAHTYAFYFNLLFEALHPRDLLDFAFSNGLSGCSLYIYDGGSSSLACMNKKQRSDFRAYAESLGLAIFLEISQTHKKAVDEVAELALDLGAKNIRTYARYEGPLSSVLERIGRDLDYMADVGSRLDLNFDFEQHEDLKALEIFDLLSKTNSKYCNALFDFTNMINAYETPVRALRDMAPFIRQVHIKGGSRAVEPAGWAQNCVAFGSEADHIPAARLFYELLMLGDDQPQVAAFIMEQEAGYYAPPFRSPNDGPDPYIPFRAPSETPVPDGTSKAKLLQDEKCLAQDMVHQVQMILEKLKAAALNWLG